MAFSVCSDNTLQVREGREGGTSPVEHTYICHTYPHRYQHCIRLLVQYAVICVQKEMEGAVPHVGIGKSTSLPHTM